MLCGCRSVWRSFQRAVGMRFGVSLAALLSRSAAEESARDSQFVFPAFHQYIRSAYPLDDDTTYVALTEDGFFTARIILASRKHTRSATRLIIYFREIL